MKHNDEHDDEETSENSTEFEGAYVVDDDTADLLATAIGIIHLSATMQMGEDHRENLLIIADELQARFAIESDSIAVEEQLVVNPDTGEQELLYRPRGGVMGDEPEQEAEGPAADS